VNTSIPMSMIPAKAVSITVAALVAIGGGVFYIAYYGGINAAIGAQQTQTSVEGSSTVSPYDCPMPAVNSELLCYLLPAGYTVQPRLPNSPDAYCLSNMSASACTVLKQTQGNGICDPNETPWTSPLDCACTGALVPDPFQGRCAAPATVCQLALQEQAAKQNG
jgi:hypothetical protein